MSWLVAQTFTGCEFRAAHALHATPHPYYLPKFFDATRKIPRPLFPRYIFVHDLGDYVFSLLHSIFAVSRVVHFGEELARVSDAAIAGLRARENEFGNIVLPGIEVPRRLRIGDRVIVLSGPFVGLSGIYQGPNARNYARVDIEFLNRSAATLIEHRLLERLPPEPGAASSKPPARRHRRRKRRSRSRRRFHCQPASMRLLESPAPQA